MNPYRLLSLWLAFMFYSHSSIGQTDQLVVHFLYGSKPKKEFRGEEQKWFGGIHGGHVGVEIGPNKILNFIPSGDFHYVSHKKKLCSRFALHERKSFYSLFGGDVSNVRRIEIIIPIESGQRNALDSLAKAYLERSPYDYAFLGMRCGAAGYDILASIGLIKDLKRRTWRKIFYPKKLRKRLVRMAKDEHWKVLYIEGQNRRKWEKDDKRTRRFIQESNLH